MISRRMAWLIFALVDGLMVAWIAAGGYFIPAMIVAFVTVTVFYMADVDD